MHLGYGEAHDAYARALSLRASDGAAAMRMLRRAAAAGHAEAQAIIGQAHAQGLGGTTVDVDESLRWLRAAAAQGHSDATYNLVALCEARSGDLEPAA